MSLLGYWLDGLCDWSWGVFCWLRDVLWDGCLGSLCNCLVGCCDWFLTVGFVVGWSGFGFWFRVGL